MMSAVHTPSIHPELQIIKDHCAVLRMQLKNTLQEWHRLSVEERPRLLARYDAVFGALERKRQQIAVESAEVFRKVELCSIRLARGEALSREFIEMISSNGVRNAPNSLGMETADMKPANTEQQGGRNLVDMYRVLVKKLHPDAVNEKEVNPMWYAMQEAYANKNEQKLQSLLAVVGAETVDESITREWTLDRWKQEEETLQTRLRVEKRKLARLKTEQPFPIADDLYNNEWIEKHKQNLKADIQSRQSALKDYQCRYQEMTYGL